MKPRILITFGDSFTYGIGNLHPDLYKEVWDSVDEERNFLQNPIQKKYELDNSWGIHIANQLNMDYYLNISNPQWSIGTTWKNFLESDPRDTFNDYDVHVIFMAGYTTRMDITKGTIWDSINPSVKLYDQWVQSLVHNNDNVEESLTFYNHSQLREIILQLKDWNWKFTLGFNDLEDEIKFREYIKFTDIIDPSFEGGMFKGPDAQQFHVEYDSHINEDGYKFVANHIIGYLNENHSSWFSSKKTTPKSYGWGLHRLLILGYEIDDDLFKVHRNKRFDLTNTKFI